MLESLGWATETFEPVVQPHVLKLVRAREQREKLVKEWR